MTGNLTGRGRTVRRIAAAGLAVLSLGVAGCDKFKSKQLIREGNAYFKEQLYEDALKKYEAAQALDPTEVRLDKFVAMGYMALYNPGSTHPKDIEALNRSIEHFKKYLAAKPDDEKAARFLVTTYMNAQKYDEAIKYFKELVEKHPQDSQAVQTIAMLYAKQGDYENSIDVAEEARRARAEQRRGLLHDGRHGVGQVLQHRRRRHLPRQGPHAREAEGDPGFRHGAARQGDPAQPRLLRGHALQEPALPAVRAHRDGPG